MIYSITINQKTMQRAGGKRTSFVQYSVLRIVLQMTVCRIVKFRLEHSGEKAGKKGPPSPAVIPIISFGQYVTLN